MSTAVDAPEETSSPPDTARPPRRVGDTIFSGASALSGILILVTLAGVAVFLLWRALPAMTTPFEDLSGRFSWIAGASLADYVGRLVFGTVYASAMALVMAVPVAIGIALFISHYAPRRLAQGLGYVVDLLAAVPSIVFGLWGGVWLVPRLEPLYVFLNSTLGSIRISLPEWIPLLPPIAFDLFPIFAGDLNPPGRNLFSASVVLAVMILPIITAVTRETFVQVPRLHEEAALALGATRWEMIAMTVFPFARGGMISGAMLGLGRALGETMAVLMILSPGFTYSAQALIAGRHQTIAANIAAQQPEADPQLGMSVLVFTGLVLFVITLLVNMAARAIVNRRKEFSGAN